MPLEFNNADINKIITFTFLLRRPNSPKDYADNIISGGGNPILSHEEFDSVFGATADDISTVVNYLASQNFNIIDAHSGGRSVKVSATAGQINSLLKITLVDKNGPDGNYLDYIDNIILPTEISDIVEHVIGLNNNKFKLVNAVRAAGTSTTATITLVNGAVTDLGYRSNQNPNLRPVTPAQAAAAYNAPAGDGAGQCIGIIELYGGYLLSDIQASFSNVGLSTPNIVDVTVDAAMTPTTYGGDLENYLDIFCAGGVAPAAKIAIYWGVNGIYGLYNCIAAAIHDTVNNPSVLSLSYIFFEEWFRKQDLLPFEDLLHAAVIKGITLCAASGDWGSTYKLYYSGLSRSLPANAYPVSSQYTLGCGGTSLQINSSTNAVISEIIWNDHGVSSAGISNYWPAPQYQKGLFATDYYGNTSALTMRAWPDVVLNGAFYSGYIFYIHGYWTQVGGTSAAAPLMAGLIARINSNKNIRLGYCNNLFYANTAAFRNITTGTTVDFSDNVKIDVQWSNQNSAQMYAGSTFVGTATFYNLENSRIWYQLRDSDQTTPVVQLYNNYITVASTGTVTVTSPFIANKPPSGALYAGFYDYPTSNPYSEICVNIENSPRTSGPVSQYGIVFKGDFHQFGYASIVNGNGIGSIMTATDVIYNATGQSLKTAWIGPEGVWYGDYITIPSSPYTATITIPITDYGEYICYFLDGQTNGYQWTRIRSFNVVDSQQFPYLAPGPFPGYCGWTATTGYSVAAGVGAPNMTAIQNLIPTSTRGFGMLFPKSKKSRPSSGIMWPRM